MLFVQMSFVVVVDYQHTKILTWITLISAAVKESWGRWEHMWTIAVVVVCTRSFRETLAEERLDEDGVGQ